MEEAIIEESVVQTSERKLATFRVIEEVKDIPNADRIQAYRVDGWWVVGLRDEYNVGDTVIYFEVDSWIPTTIAPFLTPKGHYPKVYNGVEGERLRTIKLRGQLSQGLIMPLSILNDAIVENSTLDEYLNIQKWERPLSPQLAGVARGNFPSFIKKTDEERVQNLKQNEIEGLYEVTEKLDGSSMTVYLHDGEFGVCSRNINLKETEDNTFWSVARKYSLEETLRDMRLHFDRDFAIQGELCGPGIQKNIYGLKEHKFFVYNIFDIDNQTKIEAPNRRELCSIYELDHVPLCYAHYEIDEDSLSYKGKDEILNLAEDKSFINKDVDREGLVFKDLYDPNHSFKAISNKFLLKHE